MIILYYPRRNDKKKYIIALLILIAVILLNMYYKTNRQQQPQPNSNHQTTIPVKQDTLYNGIGFKNMMQTLAETNVKLTQIVEGASIYINTKYEIARLDEIKSKIDNLEYHINYKPLINYTYSTINMAYDLIEKYENQEKMLDTLVFKKDCTQYLKKFQGLIKDSLDQNEIEYNISFENGQQVINYKYHNEY